MSNVFKDFFWNLATSLLVKFPDLSNKYNLEPIFLYYSNFVIPEVIHIKSNLEEKVFKIMENIEISKLPGRFLEDGAKILSKPISEIYSLSISHGIFPNTCKVAKLKPIFKKGKKVDPSNYRPISWKKSCERNLVKEILWKKLEAIGFWGECIRWVRSYLWERIFFIQTENQLSDYGKI